MDAARSLPLADLEQVEDLIQAGEQRVAFENLCTQIYEYDVRLPMYLRGLLAEAGEHLGVLPAFRGERGGVIAGERVSERVVG
jgi:hypothetical protein